MSHVIVYDVLPGIATNKNMGRIHIYLLHAFQHIIISLFLRHKLCLEFAVKVLDFPYDN